MHSARAPSPRARRRRAVARRLYSGVVLAGLATVIVDCFLPTRMPPAWMAFLMPAVLIAGLPLPVWLWLWCVRQLARLAHLVPVRGEAGATGQPDRPTRSRGGVAVVGIGALAVAVLEGVVMLITGVFLMLDASLGWQRVVDLDGTVYWEEPVFPDGQVYHRELPSGRVRSVGEYWCDDPGCGPPLRRARWERAVAAAEQSPASPEPDHATGAPSQSSPQPSAESDRVGDSFPQVRGTLPAMAITVTDASGQTGLTGRGIEVARREGGAWRPIGSIPSTGEPVLLVCQNARCLAGIGTARGGEVWTSADHGVTWTDHSGDLPSSLPAEQRFLTSATFDAASGTWDACLSYPSWVGSDAQPVCVPVAG